MYYGFFTVNVYFRITLGRVPQFEKSIVFCKANTFEGRGRSEDDFNQVIDYSIYPIIL